MLAKSTSERECRCRRGVATPGYRSFPGLPHWGATCSRTGVCHIHNHCWDAARIATGNSVALPSPFSLKLEPPLGVGDRVDIFGTLNAAPGGNMCLFTLEGAVVPCPNDMHPGSRIRVTVQRYKNRLCVYRCGQEVFAAGDLSPPTFSGGLELSSVMKPSAVWIVSGF
ncbi:hypothetical protein HPB47_012166 [Ixodes persulcatus]|uniref:Uncharacterized protein n=1 Tax=Ixodes persulcatus TaxID=34615 RepID=A0AC60NUF1_IXOPE|nr:hypothetical protein HPB47_012166 [Ixodes persulcatus]